MFHNTTSDLQDQDQDHSVQYQAKDGLLFTQTAETGLILRMTVSDHIIGRFALYRGDRTETVR